MAKARAEAQEREAGLRRPRAAASGERRVGVARRGLAPGSEVFTGFWVASPIFVASILVWFWVWFGGFVVIWLEFWCSFLVFVKVGRVAKLSPVFGATMVGSPKIAPW